MVTFKRLGKNRRLVLRFEWLTLWPVCAVFPVRSHRRDMVSFLVSPKRAKAARNETDPRRGEDGTYSHQRRERQGEGPGLEGPGLHQQSHKGRILHRWKLLRFDA